MSNSFELKRGSYIHRKGRVWEVVVIKNGFIQLKDESDELAKMSFQDWQLETFEGKAYLTVKDAVLPEGKAHWLTVELKDMQPEVQVAAKRASFYVNAYRDPVAFYREQFPNMPAENRHLPRGRSRRTIKPFLEHVALAYGDSNAPGFTTLLSWLDLAATAGSFDARVWAPAFADRGPRKRQMNARVHEWLEEFINTAYLTGRRNKKRLVYRLLRRKVNLHNESNPSYQLEMISERHVYRYIAENVDKYVKMARREGREKADSEFKPVGLGPEPSDILEIVEVDHTQADVDVCDDDTGAKLGRPWITVALDRYSRMVVGIHVHFGPPPGCTR